MVSVSEIVRTAKRNLKARTFWAVSELLRILVPKGVHKALLVLKIDAIGDLFVWFSSGIADVAAYSRKHEGGAVILVRKELAGFISELGLFAEVWPIDAVAFRSNLIYRVKLLHRLRCHGFSEVFQARIARDFLTEDLITRTVGADIAQSPVGDHSNLTAWEAHIGDAWYRPILRFDGGPAHELARHRALTAAAFGRPAERFQLTTVRSRYSAGLRPDYFIVAPGAGWAQRRWPVENFIELAQRLTQSRGLQCVVVGSGADAADGERIKGRIGGDTLNLCGKLGLMDLAALVERATVVIGNESGPVHIAAYFKVTSVAILGGGHYGWFMPYPSGLPGVKPPRIASVELPCFGCNWICRYQIPKGNAVPCIQQVPVELAWLELSAALADENRENPNQALGV